MRTRTNEVRDREIARLRASGIAARVIAAQFGMTSQNVHRIYSEVRREGPVKRDASPPRPPPKFRPIRPDKATLGEVAEARREMSWAPPFKGRIG